MAHANAFTGAGNRGFIFIALKPLDARDAGAGTVIGRLRGQLSRLPVASAYLQAAQDLQIGGRAGNAQYQYTLQADTTQELSKWGPTLLARMKRLPGLLDVSSDQQNGGLKAYLTYDRARAAELGLTPQTLDSSLYSAFGQSEASVIYTQLNQYYAILEVAPEASRSPAGLQSIYLPVNNNGSLDDTIPLSVVASSRLDTTPLLINHTGLFPSATVSFNLGPNLALSDATRLIDRMRAELECRRRFAVFSRARSRLTSSRSAPNHSSS